VRRLEPRQIEPAYCSYRGITWLFYPDLEASGIHHGIAVLRGSLPPFDRGSFFETAASLWQERFGCPMTRLVVPKQVHGSKVIIVSQNLPGDPVCDGLVSVEPGVGLGVTVADCIPLLAFNSGRGVVGIAHCGWRGIAAGIVEELTEKLRNLGCHLDETVFFTGPAIGKCCYEIGEDLLDVFSDEVTDFCERRGDRLYLDLKALVPHRLVIEGADPNKISIDKTCTSCQKLVLTSFRASGSTCGRMLAIVAS